MDSKLLYFFAGALVALIAAVATHAWDTRSPPKSPASVLLSPADYMEIQQLYGMYARDVDPGSVRDASWLFAKDAVVVMDTYKTITTPDEIKAFYLNVQKQQRAGVRHFNTSYVIVGTPDGGARGSSYMMQVETLTEGGLPQVTLFGKYEDKFVKTAEGWRFKERVWRSDTFRGTTKPVSASPVPGDRQTDTTGIDAGT